MVIVLTKKLKFWKHIPKFKPLPVKLELLTRCSPISHDFVIYGTQRKEKKNVGSIDSKSKKGSSIKDTDSINNSTILTKNSRTSTHESSRQGSSSFKIDQNRSFSGDSRTGSGIYENSTLMSTNSYETNSSNFSCYHVKKKHFNPTIIGNFYGHIHKETKLKIKLEALEFKKKKETDEADVDLREKPPIFKDIVYDAYTFLDQSKKNITRSLIKWNNDHAINEANKYKMEEELKIRTEELRRKEEYDRIKKYEEENKYQSRVNSNKQSKKSIHKSVNYDDDTISSFADDDFENNKFNNDFSGYYDNITDMSNAIKDTGFISEDVGVIDVGNYNQESNIISESESKLKQQHGGFISEDGGLIDFEADIINSDSNIDSIQDVEDGTVGDSERPYIEYLDKDNPPYNDYLGYSSDENDYDNVTNINDNDTKKTGNTASSRGGTANSKGGSSRTGTPSGAVSRGGTSGSTG
jgi:hypothetical protein